MIKRTCVICSKEFDFWHSKAKTCGRECSKIYEKELKRRYKINNPDKVRNSSKKYNYRIRIPKLKLCKMCGKEFQCKGNNLTCSTECKLKNRRINSSRNSKKWVENNPAKRKETCRKYTLKNTERLSKKSSEWAKKNPEKVKERVKRWRKENRDKRNAEANAQYNIPIPSERMCEICKRSNLNRIERHHPDYSRPLQVMFLCSRCHKRIHTGIIKQEVCNESGVQSN